jgi:hypothetical protein
VRGLVGFRQIALNVAVRAADPERSRVVVHQACYLACGDPFESLNVLEKLFSRRVLGLHDRPGELTSGHETE